MNEYLSPFLIDFSLLIICIVYEGTCDMKVNDNGMDKGIGDQSSNLVHFILISLKKTWTEFSLAIDFFKK